MKQDRRGYKFNQFVEKAVMPTVLRVGKYRFHFFSNEGNEPAHIHVKAGVDEAKFWLSPVTLAVNYGFKAHELNDIKRTIMKHQIELLEAWNEYPRN